MPRTPSPAESAAVRSATIGEIVSSQATLLAKSTHKIDLRDINAVKAVTENLMQKCAEIGCLPNFELLAAAFGMSRRGLYRHLENHPDSETSIYLDTVRTAWAGMRQMAADKGAADVTASIFILLNSSLGFTNQHQVEISTPQSPLESFYSSEQIDQAKQRYLDALGIDDEEGSEEI